MSVRWIDNIEKFISEKNIKIGDFEKSIGVSAGYLSRLKARIDNGEDVVPTVPILNKISQVLGVSMDMLINFDIPPCHDNLTTLMRVIDKLIDDTNEKNIEWYPCSEEMLKYRGEDISLSLFKREKNFYDGDDKTSGIFDIDNPEECTRRFGECSYISKFGSLIKTSGTTYTAFIEDSNMYVHIIGVSLCNVQGWDVYIEKFGHDTEGLFTTLVEPTDMLADKVKDLIECIKRNQIDAIISPDLKKIIDEYLEG